jgi:GT2 family glycosyltransferase/lipopolysaccharide/colanic/teichoic acid biosynthesis glycosyltransferase
MMDISVIIVNYNVKNLLENCINSVLISSRNYNTEIIIVDNNSFDGSYEYISSKFCSTKNIKIIRSKINLGFAKANNLGINQASGKYLLILNPDTLLQENTIEKCINFYDSDQKIGALSCKLILPNGKLDLACRRSFPSSPIALYRLVGLSKLFSRSKIFGKYNLTFLDENSTYEVESICGAYMLIKKDLFDQLGGFDEDYFMYGEDLDLCYKIKKAGYKIYYYSGTSAIHYKGESTKKSSISYVNNFYGAMRIFVEKNLHKNYTLMNILIKSLIFYRASLSYFNRFFKTFYPILIDLFLIVSAMLLSIGLRFESFPIEAYTYVIVFYTLVWLLSLSLSGSYKHSNTLSFIKPLNGILIGFFVNSSFTYFFNEFAFSRVVVIRTTAYAYLFLLIWRFVLKLIVYSKQKNLFHAQSNTLIVGKNVESERFVNKLKMKVDTDYNILGYISTNGDETNKDFVGNTNNLEDLIAAQNVKNLIFAKSELTNMQILDLMWDLKNYNLNYKILSSDNELILGKSALDKIDDIYLMQIEYNINKKFNIFVKRIFDITLGCICLILIYPPVFLFVKIFKPSSDSLKFYSKVLLIPAVIKGELSFVGRAMWDTSSSGKQSLGEKGLTGLVQINYFKKLNEEEIEYYNNYYAKNQTLLLDIEIILKTLSLFVFRNKIIKL